MVASGSGSASADPLDGAAGVRRTYVLRGSEFPRANGATTIKLPIKVVPASSRNCIAGWLGETLKVRVTAPAERGRANAAVEMTLAEALGVSQKCARVITGKTSPRKIVEIVGLSESEVYRRLSKGAA